MRMFGLQMQIDCVRKARIEQCDNSATNVAREIVSGLVHDVSSRNVTISLCNPACIRAMRIYDGSDR
jgi:hypothetical protein